MSEASASATTDREIVLERGLAASRASSCTGPTAQTPRPNEKKPPTGVPKKLKDVTLDENSKKKGKTLSLRLRMTVRFVSI